MNRRTQASVDGFARGVPGVWYATQHEVASFWTHRESIVIDGADGSGALVLDTGSDRTAICIDDREIPCPGPMTTVVAEEYAKLVRGEIPKYKEWVELA